MMLYLVVWTFVLALAPVVLGFAWQQTGSVVRGLASTLYGFSVWAGGGDRFSDQRLTPVVVTLQQSQAGGRNLGRKNVEWRTGNLRRSSPCSQGERVPRRDARDRSS